MMVILIGFLAFTTLVDLLCITTPHEIIFPSSIYRCTKMNWFGCWFLYILLAILSPLVFICKWLVIGMYYLTKWIKWLFTVGRKDD